jgi:hypothetical protein
MAIREATFVSGTAAGMIVGVAGTDAVVVEFSAGFFSPGLPRCATVPSSGCAVSGAAALALCKLLAKLLGPGPDGKGSPDLVDEAGNAASV